MLIGYFPFAAATAFLAASASVSAVIMLAFSSSLRPSSAFVPTRRTTIGTFGLDLVHCGEDAARDFVAAGDAAKDVEQDGFDIRVRKDDAHRSGYFFGARAAADIQEVGWFAAEQFDDVHAGHGQPCAVDHAADVCHRA